MMSGASSSRCSAARRRGRSRRARSSRAKLPTIGFLGAGTPSAWSHWTAAFVQRLRELGWIEGRTVAIEYRWAEGRSERFAEIAAEFVRLKVDVIVTVGSAVAAAKQATSTIPIVFAMAVDPVGTGMVATLARPGGNVTGLSIQSTELAGKRLELLREVLPGLRRLAIIANVGYPASVLEMGEVQAAARKLGLEVDVLEIRRAEDIAPAFGALKSGVQALYVCPDALVNANHARINTLALGARLPTIHPFRDYLAAGGLMSYGANNTDLFRRAADYVDKILRGAKPADLPVEQPTKFDLVINLTTAKALGLDVPPIAARPRRRGDRVSGGNTSCGFVSIDGLDPWLAPTRKGTSDCADEVTLSRKGTKSGTHGRKLRSSRTKAGSSLDRVREPHAELEELKTRARDLEGKLAARERELAEALEQQTATSEVLQVISNSVGDLQPVFDAMLANATRLCGAEFGILNLDDGDVLRIPALYNVPPALGAIQNVPFQVHPKAARPRLQDQAGGTHR